MVSATRTREKEGQREKTKIEPDTLKMYLGHAGSMRRTKCYL